MKSPASDASPSAASADSSSSETTPQSSQSSSMFCCARRVTKLANAAAAGGAAARGAAVSAASGVGQTAAETTIAKANHAGESFIDVAKKHGANALLGYLANTGDRFDKALRELQVTKIGDGVVTCEMPVNQHVQNAYGTLHGGAQATLVDIVGTLALLTKDPTKAGVTVELNCSYASAAKAGETVEVIGVVLKTGKKLGFTQVDIKRKSDGKLIATGRHTKAL